MSEFDSKHYGLVPDDEEPVEDTLDMFADIMKQYGDTIQVIFKEGLLRDASAEIRRLRTICEERKAEIQTLQAVVISLG